MSRKETKNNVKRHSEAKLKFYIHYLERYLPILSKSEYIKKINIYDMFCGQAIYDDGKESSAVRAFNKIKQVQENNSGSGTEITLTLNDLDEKRIKQLKGWLVAQPQSKTFTTHTYNEDATDLIKRLMGDIDNRRDARTRNLVFIDPYGYKEIDKSLIEKLLENKRTEVIIFLPINQINRFKSEIIGDDIRKDFLPLKKFVEQFGINISDVDGDIDLIEKIKQSLSFNDQYFSTSYNIKNQQGTYYGLFFMTSHIYGLEKILEVKWELDEQQGSGFNDTDQLGLFLENEALAKLKTSLTSYLKMQKTNRETYEFTLKQGFRPKHATEILNGLQKDNRLKITPEPIRKGVFYTNYENYEKGKLIKLQLTL